MTPVGHRQQLEGSAILLCLQTGQEEQAFHLSMRILAQDEYILESSLIPAVEALLFMAETNESMLSTKLQDELQTMIRKKSRSSLEFLTMETF